MHVAEGAINSWGASFIAAKSGVGPETSHLNSVVWSEVGGRRSDVGSPRSKTNLHSLGSGTDFGIVVARLFHYVVNAPVVVIGIVMKEHKLPGATLHYHIHRFAPMAVSPAVALCLVFVGQILRVIDQDVGALRQFAHRLVEVGGPRLIICGVDENAVLGLHPE